MIDITIVSHLHYQPYHGPPARATGIDLQRAYRSFFRRNGNSVSPGRISFVSGRVEYGVLHFRRFEPRMVLIAPPSHLDGGPVGLGELEFHAEEWK
jgi:hypothetical protein